MLKKLRESRHLSQLAFAGLLGLKRPFYSRIEAGERAFPREQLARACEILELSAPEAADLYAAAGVPLPPVLLSLLPPREPSPEPQLAAEGA